jgi:hypothetical protein
VNATVAGVVAPAAFSLTNNAGPAATLSSNTTAFGNVLVGVSSAPQVVTLTNGGNANLSITGITINGANAADFAQTNTCGPLPATVTPSNSCTLNLTFKPSTAAAESASLVITDNASNSPQSDALTGTGENFSLAAASGANCPSGGNCSTSATITAGQTATYNLQVSPVSSFNGAVTLTCTGAPGTSTCAASPASVASSSSYAFTVTVSNTAYVVVPPWPQFQGRPILPALRIALPLFVALLMVLFWRNAVAEKRPARALLPTLAVFLFGVMFIYGCGSYSGGGGGGTKPPTNATLTVTGSSGGVSRTVTLSLTINH